MLDASGFYFLGREGSCCLKELQKPRGPRGSAQKIDLTGETLVCATAPGELSDRGGKADWQSAHVKMLGSGGDCRVEKKHLAQPEDDRIKTV